MNLIKQFKSFGPWPLGLDSVVKIIHSWPPFDSIRFFAPPFNPLVIEKSPVEMVRLVLQLQTGLALLKLPGSFVQKLVRQISGRILVGRGVGLMGN